jgi:hypothetical protein
MSEAIEIEGVMLLGHDGINERRADFMEFLKKVNGCGAGNAKFDFVPDTMYFLSVKIVCNLHDDNFTFCDPNKKAFNNANAEFHENLKRWIKAKSFFWMVPLRLARAKTYYEAVDKFGWSSFCDCKEKLGTPIS